MNKVKKRDHHKKFTFIPLHLSEYKETDNLIYLEDEKIHHKSDAAIKIASDLEIWKPLVFISRLFPKFIRNTVYNIIAIFRYKL